MRSVWISEDGLSLFENFSQVSTARQIQTLLSRGPRIKRRLADLESCSSELSLGMTSSAGSNAMSSGGEPPHSEPPGRWAPGFFASRFLCARHFNC